MNEAGGQLEGAPGDLEPRNGLTTLLYAAAMVGIVARVVQYLWRRSYWHDEAYLVLNVTSLTFRQLVGPLPHAQSAPPGFLVAQKALFDALGSSEYVLRIVPLVLGCAAVLVMAVLARRCMGTIGAIGAVALFAVSDRLIWHAAEAKQYSGDVFFALLLWVAATDARTSEQRRLLHAAVLAAAAAWVSHPTIFVFGGIALALLPAFMRRGARGVATFALCALPALVSFAALYLLSIRHQEYGDLYAYWAERFPDWSRPWLVPLWLVKHTVGLCKYPYEIGGEVVFAFASAGAWGLWREGRRQLLGMLLAPVGLTLLASFVHRYPFGGSRVTLFLAPAMFLLAGAGLELLWRHVAQTRWRAVGVAVPALLIGIGAAQAAYFLFVPRHRGHIRPAVEYVRARRAPDERVYVVGEGSPFLCYWREPGVPLPLTPQDALRVADERFWVVYAYGNRRDESRRRMLMHEIGGKVAAIRESLRAPGSEAHRFARRATTSPASPATRP